MPSTLTRISCDAFEGQPAVGLFTNVITVEDDGTQNSTRKYHRTEESADIDITCFDGEGLISKEYTAIVDKALCEANIHAARDSVADAICRGCSVSSSSNFCADGSFRGAGKCPPRAGIFACCPGFDAKKELIYDISSSGISAVSPQGGVFSASVD